MGDMIVGIFRSILFFFDQIIYGFIPAVYSFIKILAIQQIFNSDVLQKIANNIYAILGVFMLFRLAFVLLNAIVDPDKLTDKEKGFGKIMTRVVTAIVLIVVIPYAFELAYGLQGQILEKNIVEKIILGSSADGGANYGQQMAKTSLKSFYSCNPKAAGYSDNPNNPGDCQIILEEEYNLAFPTNDPNNNSVDFSFFSSSLNQKADGEWQYNYTAGISTVAGIFILALLIMFTFDMGVRTIKLGFLQLITPVAVIGYIEPGGGIFKKWQEMCIKTYINLFIRILAISFVVLVISIISDTGTQFVDFKRNDLVGSTRTFVIIFIIIGALMFAKEAPKMLSSMFGLEEGALGSLNPLKKLASVPLIGGAAAAGIGLAGGLATKGMAGAGGILRGGISSKIKGGTFAGGALKGAGAAMKDVPLKGSVKDKMLALAKAGRKAADAGATSATGVETHTGFGNWAKDKIDSGISSAQYNRRVAQSNAEGKALYDTFKNSGENYSKIYSSKYAGAMETLRNNKMDLTNREKERQFFFNGYQQDPSGMYKYKDANGVDMEISWKDAFETANSNYKSAQKRVEQANKMITEMDGMDQFKTDANNKALIESYEQTKMPEMKEVLPGSSARPNNSPPPPSSPDDPDYLDDKIGWGQ